MPLGVEAGVAPLERRERSRTPREALEEVMLEALQRSPCLVSFSGGRDSSALLATGTDLARREGLAAPVPVTMVFPGSDAANEDAWQEAVLNHLGVSDRVRIEITGDALDGVGPVARRTLRRHGLLWPFNTHFHAPILEQAAGGVVVTGFGGDELGLLSHGTNAERILADRHVRHVRDALIVAFAVSPRWLRRLVYGRRAMAGFGNVPWLTSDGRRFVARAAGRHSANSPLGWEASVRQFWRVRYVHVAMSSLAKLGDEHGAVLVHPFVDPRVLDALAREGGFRGFGNRTQLVRRLFEDLLPEPVVSRSTKAVFNDALWTETARSFARSWSGAGLTEFVDAAALRSHWACETPHALSALLLQQAWLHDNEKEPGRSMAEAPRVAHEAD